MCPSIKCALFNPLAARMEDSRPYMYIPVFCIGAIHYNLHSKRCPACAYGRYIFSYHLSVLWNILCLCMLLVTLYVLVIYSYFVSVVVISRLAYKYHHTTLLFASCNLLLFTLDVARTLLISNMYVY